MNFFDNVTLLNKNPLTALNPNLLEAPNPKFIVLGSDLRSDVAALMEHFEVIALVDIKPSENPLIMPLAEWISLAKSDRNIFSVNLARDTETYDTFERTAKENQLPVVNLLEIMRFLKIRGSIDKTKRRNTLGLVYTLPFFLETLKQADSFAAVADSFDDDLSKQTAWSLLNYRITGNPIYLSRVSLGLHLESFSPRSYQINSEFFHPTSHEVYVDGGAFQGETIKQFLRASNQQYKHIYGFEPSKQAARIIADACKDLSDFSLLVKGLWSEKKTLRFNPLGFWSGEVGPSKSFEANAHILESGVTDHFYGDDREIVDACEVEVTSIDETAPDATFIKLEIEGSELEALQGSVRTLQKNRPTLSVGLYHKPKDWLELPKFVRDLDLGYELSIRQHNGLIPDSTVLYGVPHSRN